MKRIEDGFQELVSPIASGKAERIRAEEKPAVDKMYALWYMRARYRELKAQEIQLNGIAGSDLTKEREENLEKERLHVCEKGRNNARSAAQRIRAAISNKQLRARLGRRRGETGSHFGAIGG
jgi:hypothetical protein